MDSSRARLPARHYYRLPWVVLRLVVAIVLVLQLAYIPIHLYLVPHAHALNHALPEPFASDARHAEYTQDNGDHHHRHPATQHELKVTQPVRAPALILALLSATRHPEQPARPSQPQELAFSGLSPPELPQSWQFFFRAALPVRAPSVFA